jgi:hypothetical protein
MGGGGGVSPRSAPRHAARRAAAARAAGAPVGRALGGVDELVGQALCDGLDVAERALARAGGQQVDCAVHAAQRRDVHRLPPDHARAADARGVLARAAARGRHGLMRAPELCGLPERLGHRTVQRPHLLMIASTSTWMGLVSESRWMMSNACFTMRTASSFLPLLRPCIISEAVSLRAGAG